MKKLIIISVVFVLIVLIFFHESIAPARTVEEDESEYYLKEIKIAASRFGVDFNIKDNDWLILVYYLPGGESIISSRLLKVALCDNDTISVVYRKYYATYQNKENGLFEDRGCKIVTDTICHNLRLSHIIQSILTERIDTMKSLSTEPFSSCFDCPFFIVGYMDRKKQNVFHWHDIPEIDASGCYAQIRDLMLCHL